MLLIQKQAAPKWGPRNIPRPEEINRVHSESTLRSPNSWMCQMLDPPQLAPFDVKEQQI